MKRQSVLPSNGQTSAEPSGLLDRAIGLAVQAHSGQLDKAGEPYILHPLRVMGAMKTEEERVVAVMHDVLEDCPDWDDVRLKAEGFSDRQIAALFALTRRPRESYEDFIERVALDPLALEVKLADLRDNSNLERLAEITTADWERTAKYGRAILRLSIARLCANAADTTER